MALKFKTDDVAKAYQRIDEELRRITEATPFPVTITSAYRDPSLNKSVGGVPNSYHTSGKALDIRRSDLSGDQLNQLVDYYKNSGWQPILESDHLHIEPVGSVGRASGAKMAGNKKNGGEMLGQPPFTSPPILPGQDTTGIEQLLKLMQPQKMSTGQKIGNILSALAPVAASFHSPEAQQRATENQMARMQAQDEAQKSKIAEMLEIFKLTQPDLTDDIKEYQYAIKNKHFKGTFFDYMKELKTPPMDPMDKAIMGSPMFQSLVGGGSASNAGSGVGPATNMGTTAGVPKFRFNAKTGQLEEIK